MSSSSDLKCEQSVLLSNECLAKLPKLQSIVFQFKTIVHSLDCQLGFCPVNYCWLMKKIVRHLKYCTSGNECSVKYCLSSRRILEHWVSCRKCSICDGANDALERHGVHIKDLLRHCPGVDTLEEMDSRLLAFGHGRAPNTYGQTYGNFRPIGKFTSRPFPPNLMSRPLFLPSFRTNDRTIGQPFPRDERQRFKEPLHSFNQKYCDRLRPLSAQTYAGRQYRPRLQLIHRFNGINQVVDGFDSLVLDSTIELDTE